MSWRKKRYFLSMKCTEFCALKWLLRFLNDAIFVGTYPRLSILDRLLLNEIDLIFCLLRLVELTFKRMAHGTTWFFLTYWKILSVSTQFLRNGSPWRKFIKFHFFRGDQKAITYTWQYQSMINYILENKQVTKIFISKNNTIQLHGKVQCLFSFHTHSVW